MVKEAATAIAVLIGTGAVNALPVGSQDRASDTTTITPDAGNSQLTVKTGAGYVSMLSNRDMNPYVDSDHSEMMTDGPMGSHLADRNYADHTSKMGGEYAHMMTGELRPRLPRHDGPRNNAGQPSDERSIDHPGFTE